MTVVSGSQLTLDFTPGLTERHETILDCIRASAYTHKHPLKVIAADMDMSQSELSRKLSGNPDDSRRFTVDDLERFIKASGDLTPVYYLVEKYLTDEDMRQRRAMAELAKQLPDVLALIKTVSRGSSDV